jgi:hypothetical protein
MNSMENGDRKSTPSQKPEIRSKKQIQVFLVCLVIATCIWFMIKLSKEYTYETVCHVSYLNFPKEKVLTRKPDTLITLSLKASGYFTLYRRFFNPARKIEIDLSRLKTRKNGSYYDANLSTLDLYGVIQSRLSRNERLSAVYPGTLQFRFEYAASRKVPVRPSLDITYQKQYGLYDRIYMMPDSVLVTGPRDQIDTLRFVVPERLVLSDINVSQNITLPLHPELMEGNVRFDHEYVRLIIPVAEYTESRFTIPLEVDSLPEGLSIKTYPEEVSVVLRHAVRDYNRIKPEMIRASVNAAHAIRDAEGKLKVMVFTAPDFTGVTAIEPERVEFILSK